MPHIGIQENNSPYLLVSQSSYIMQVLAESLFKIPMIKSFVNVCICILSLLTGSQRGRKKFGERASGSQGVVTP